ncbi:oxidase [Pseudomonas sp. NPDC089554]|uniref:oxidase n=1 Tax=Pseudomonas sp. NPDC089554 TaxID=3390653 RepID=UPI003D011F53
MSILSVFHPESPQQPRKVLTHHEDVATTLAEQGVRLTQQPHDVRIRPGSGEETVLAQARHWLDGLMTEYGSRAYRVLDHDGAALLDASLRDEQVHDADEVFAVITGRAQVSLRLGGQVFSVLCEKGDVLVIPSGTRRWVDLGETPFCLAVRLFASEQGALGRLTGDPQAREFLGFDEF